MKKKVNGQTVEIKNIEVFEKAAEGMALNRTVTSDLNDTTSVDFDTVDKYITLYNSFYKSLPFPIYALDNDLKYAAIGCYIQNKLGEPVRIWVNNGLFICIEEERKIVLKFVNSTWGLTKVDNLEETNIDLREYQGESGFTDVVWALSKVLKNESTSTYYKEFMADFIKACNNQPMVLRWELSNILDFGRVPNRYNFEDNKIIDLNSLDEYTVDIFISGVRESKEKQNVWTISDVNGFEESTKSKLIKQYGFEVYVKQSVDANSSIKPNCNKLKRCELFGAVSLFNTLNSIRAISEGTDFDTFKAFICDDEFVYIVNGRIFIAKASRYVEPKEIARGVELYAYDRSMIYFVKPKMIGKGIRKETIYSYSLKDGKLRLCKIQFVNV